MYYCLNGGAPAPSTHAAASLGPGSGGSVIAPLKSVPQFEKEINGCDNLTGGYLMNYNKLKPIAKIVLALTRQSLRDYTGDINEFKNHPLRWNLMATIGRLKSYGDIHYLSEALIRCKLENKELFMTSVDKGVAGLTRHYASLMGIKATIVVQLGISSEYKLHVFKTTGAGAGAGTLTLEQCCKALNITELTNFSSKPANAAASAAASAAAASASASAASSAAASSASASAATHITNRRALEWRDYEARQKAKNGFTSPENEPSALPLVQPNDINQQLEIAAELDKCTTGASGTSRDERQRTRKHRPRKTRKHRPRKTRKRNRKNRKTRKV